MKSMSKFQISRMLFVAFLLVASAQLFAATTYAVKGRVVNTQKQPVHFATAVLQNAQTLEIIAGGICNAKGIFVFDDIMPGEYNLLVNHVGFKKAQSRKIILTETEAIIDKTSIILE